MIMKHFLVLFAAVMESRPALRCYECAQPGGCGNLETIICSDANASCFSRAEGRGCLTNCIINSSTQCCDSDLCNTETAPTPTTQHPLRCYVCSQENMDKCDLQRVETTCTVGDVCRIEEQKDALAFGGAVWSFQRDCISEERCDETDDCEGMFAGNCIRCCNCDLCNGGDINTPVTCPTPFTIPDTAPSIHSSTALSTTPRIRLSTAPSTTPRIHLSTAPITIPHQTTSFQPPQCYHCSGGVCSVDDITARHVPTKNCSSGQICSEQKIGTTFTRDCYDRTSCSKVGEYMVFSPDTCTRCCDSDMCNNKEYPAKCQASITNPVSGVLLSFALIVKYIVLAEF